MQISNSTSDNIFNLPTSPWWFCRKITKVLGQYGWIPPSSFQSTSPIPNPTPKRVGWRYQAAHIEHYSESECLTNPGSSFIEALPTVTIRERDAELGLNCAVCLEDLKKHTRARQMPCNHMYHSDCIVPWLLQHNSCPFCRLQLPTKSHGSVIKGDFFSFFRPFDGSSERNYETGGPSSTWWRGLKVLFLSLIFLCK